MQIDVQQPVDNVKRVVVTAESKLFIDNNHMVRSD